MNRKLIIVLSVFSILALLVFGYKWKQKKFLGMSTPQVETVTSIDSYAKKHALSGVLIYAKDKISQEFLSKSFSFPKLYVITKDSVLLNCNLLSLGGSCYQDIEDEICKGMPIKKREFKNGFNGKQVLDTLFKYSVIPESVDRALKNGTYKYVVIYSWVKYAHACVAESSIRFLRCIDNSNTLVLSVNTDEIK